MRRLVIKDTQTIRRKVYDHLREMLLSGEIRPHEHLIEAKIAGEIGTSRTPVREAFHSLELEGLIQSIPRVGYVVKPLHEEEVEEICEIRGVIEKLAAQRAIEKAHEELVDQLKKNVSTSYQKVSGGDARAFVDFDAQFHEVIARSSGSQRLLELAQTLRRHMLRYRLQSIYHKEQALRAIRGHKRILQGIERRSIKEINKAISRGFSSSKASAISNSFACKSAFINIPYPFILAV